MMLKFLLRFTLLALLSLAPQAGHFAVAQGLTCESVFVTEKSWTPFSSWQTYHEGLLDANTLRAQNLKIEGDKLIDLKTQEVLGVVKFSNTKYLFQWAGFTERKDWIKTGIDESYMDTILEADPQTSGRGYYVSLNPVDSSSYGNSLTTFKTNGAVVVLENETEKLKQLSVSQLKRYAKAGIDGIRGDGYKTSWLSVISSRHLQDATEWAPDVLEEVSVNPDNYVANWKILSTLPEKKLKLLRQDNIMRRLLLGESAPPDEIVNLIQNSNDPDRRGYLVSGLAKQLTAISSPEEALQILKQVQDHGSHLFVITSYRRHLEPTNEQQALYLSMLDIFDIKNVATVGMKNAAEPLTLNMMKKAANRFLTVKNSLRLKGIKTVNDLLKAAEDLYGVKYKFRDETVVMGSSEQTEQQVIQVDAASFENLRNQPLLTVTKASGKNKSGAINAEVDYFALTPQKLKDIEPFLSKEVLAEARTYLESKKFDDESKAYKTLLQKVLRDALDSLLQRSLQPYLEPGGSRTAAVGIYQQFMTLHPMRDGNGRLGRLLFAVAEENMRNYKPKMKEPTVHLDLPIYDMDVFVDAKKYEEIMAVGSALKYWIIQARDDADFINRSRWSLELFLRLYPEQRGNFPEVEQILKNGYH